MAVPSSGAIDLKDLQDEFGGSNPISISEYYRGGSLVPTNNTDVPTSGTIALSDFYGAVNEIGVTASAASSANLQTLFNNASANSWTSAVPKKYTINNGTTMGILTAPASMGGTLIINNSGNIQGEGGNSSGEAGHTAMTVQSTGITINMLSGSTLSGGAGAGGAGGTGGAGNYVSYNGTTGCNTCPSGVIYNTYCSCCCNGCSNEGNPGNIYRCGNNNATSGGAGGAFGNGIGFSQSQSNGGSGSGGGTSAGTGGAGGNGGSSYASAGSNGATGANGNAGSGAGGATGGAAGRAVTFSGVSAYTIIGTNSGTIHGAFT